MNSQWWTQPAAQPNLSRQQAAEARQSCLTKPPGSLGRLESVAIRLAALQGVETPRVERVSIHIFAADHGVAAEGVSAFPQSVTASMLDNFAAGGAAINVLARELGAKLEVVNLGTVGEVAASNIRHQIIAPGTTNFCAAEAMTTKQLEQALDAGQQAVERARDHKTDLFIGGEMGIANTTAATALACAVLDTPAEVIAGPGTGLDAQGVRRKVAVVERALALHRPFCHSPWDILQRLGGFEIAALSGAYVHCAQQGLPVLVDGFISSVAALLASRLCPGTEHWFLFAHASAEPGHRRVLQALHAEPLLDLGLRLGEGSGAAVAVPLLRAACALHTGMATFASAGVAEKTR